MTDTAPDFALPWSVSKISASVSDVVDGRSRIIFEDLEAEFAAFIVTTVNDAAALDAEIERLCEALEKIEIWADDRSDLNGVFAYCRNSKRNGGPR